MITTTVQRQFAVLTPPLRSLVRAAKHGASSALACVPVLVIEDEAMIAWMLESLLEEMGFEKISLASSAMDAAAAAERRTPELVISDINLGPGADGIEAVSAIYQTCAPVVIFVSAYVDENARSRIADQVPGARIVSKPLTGDGLSAIIRDTLC